MVCPGNMCMATLHNGDNDAIIIIEAELIRRTQQKKTAYLKAKIEELQNNSKIKNIRDLYRGISGFKEGYQPITNLVKMRMGIWLQTPTVFWLGGGIISPNH